MRLPEFTAEASVYRASRLYTGFYTRASQPDASSVTAQQLVGGVDVDFWQGVAQRMIDCKPPFCGYDQNGQCHCTTDMLLGGGVLHQNPSAG